MRTSQVWIFAAILGFGMNAFAGWVSSGKTSDAQKVKTVADFKPGELKGLQCPEIKDGESYDELVKKTQCQPKPEQKK